MIATLTTWQNPQRNPASSWVRLLTVGDIPKMCWAGQGCSLFWDCPHPRPQASTNLHFIYRSHHRMLAAFFIPYSVCPVHNAQVCYFNNVWFNPVDPPARSFAFLTPDLYPIEPPRLGPSHFPLRFFTPSSPPPASWSKDLQVRPNFLTHCPRFRPSCLL